MNNSNYDKLDDVSVMLADAIARLRSIQARIAVGVSPEGVADTEMVLVPARASKGMIEECFDTEGWDSDDYASQETAYRRWIEAAVVHHGDGKEGWQRLANAFESGLDRAVGRIGEVAKRMEGGEYANPVFDDAGKIIGYRDDAGNVGYMRGL